MILKPSKCLTSRPIHDSCSRPISQEEVDEAYRDQAKWTRMSIMSAAGSGYFSSDRTIRQYAEVRTLASTCPSLLIRAVDLYSDRTIRQDAEWVRQPPL